MRGGGGSCMYHVCPEEARSSSFELMCSFTLYELFSPYIRMSSGINVHMSYMCKV